MAIAKEQNNIIVRRGEWIKIIYIYIYIYIYIRFCDFEKQNDRAQIKDLKLQSRYYVHFRANTLGKGMNSFILPAMV